MNVPVGRKRGFTLVELVAVTSLVTLGMSLALPGLQKVRNGARMMICKNNLKQIGLALHLYHETQKLFPPGWIIKSPKADAGPGFGWGALITPYLEQANIYNQLNFNASPDVNKITQTKLEVFLCPDDTMPVLNSVRGKYGTSNYSGVSGDSPLPGSVDLPNPGTPEALKLSTGTFFHNSSVGIAQMRDGTSNTIVVGEKSATSAAGIWVGVRSNQNASDSVTDCSHRARLNSVLGSFSSQHGGGAHFVMGDGAVRFISDSIDSQESTEQPNGTYQKLAHKDDGQVITEY